MKKLVSILCIAILFYLLLFPSKVIPEVTHACMIWYKHILPTLLPFTILSYIFIESELYTLFNKLFYPLLHLLLPLSQTAVFPLSAGYLFGFPLGSKITADLVRRQALSPKEASILCAMCNQISPAYITGVICYQLFNHAFSTIGTLLLIYVPSLLLGRYYYKKLLRTAPQNTVSHTDSYSRSNSKKTTSRFQFEFKIIDAAIMNGFETMLKLCGYIIIFALCIGMLECFTIKNEWILTLITGSLELTNGISRISDGSFAIEIKYALCVLFLSFGGVSCFVQTLSMIKNSGISFLFYIKFKLLCTACTMIMTLLYLFAQQSVFS